MEIQNRDGFSPFIRANELYHKYILLGLIVFPLYVLLGSFILLYIFPSVNVAWILAYSHFAVILPLVFLSFNIISKTSNLIKQVHVRELYHYALEQFFSHLFMLILIIYYISCFILQGINSAEIFWYEERIYNPIGPELLTFIFDFYEPFLNQVFWMTLMGGIFALFTSAFLLVGIFCYIQSYVELNRIYLRFTSETEDQYNISKSYRRLYFIIILFLVNLIISFGVCSLHIQGIVDFITFFMFIIAIYVVILLFAEQLVLISKKMSVTPLNLEYQSFISTRLYKFETNMQLSKKAIRFTPLFPNGSIKDIKGLPPAFGMICLPPALILFLMLLTAIYWLIRDPWYQAILFDYIMSMVIVSLIILPLFIIVFMSLNYFKIERTPEEIVFQKRFKKDHIPLEIINEVAVDYEIIETAADIYRSMVYINSSAKLRLYIILFIPNHTICITRDIKMVFSKNDKESFESQLVKVLTKTLFILGYTPQQSGLPQFQDSLQ